MRCFIVLCLVAMACAERPGYNYQINPITGHSLNDGLIGNNGGPSTGIFGGGIIDGGLSGSGNIVNELRNSGDVYDGSSYNIPVSEFNKDFYSFSAPESEFDDPSALQRIASSVKKGLRVVFIKGPENKGLEDAALALAKQAADQKTAIYVLNKQSDIGELANKLNNINKNANARPDVHFVKYRTPEDAVNAQRAIQSQYDSLGGSSQSHNGGIAPVLNFASQGAIRTVTAKSPGNEYLPSSIFRRV